MMEFIIGAKVNFHDPSGREPDDVGLVIDGKHNNQSFATIKWDDGVETECATEFLTLIENPQAPSHEDIQQGQDETIEILAKALRVITSPCRVASDEHARRVATTALADAKLT